MLNFQLLLGSTVLSIVGAIAIAYRPPPVTKAQPYTSIQTITYPPANPTIMGMGAIAIALGAVGGIYSWKPNTRQEEIPEESSWQNHSEPEDDVDALDDTSNPLLNLLEEKPPTAMSPPQYSSLNLNLDPDPWEEERLFVQPKLNKKDEDLKELRNFFSDSFHVLLNGSTGSGKTTLCEWGINQSKGGEVYLLDPKYIPLRPTWSYKPQCEAISDIPIQLKKLVDRMEKRRKGEEDASQKLNIIIDEWDWIYGEHGKSCLSILRMLFKVGRDLNIKVWLCGQSPLAKDTGLSGSDYRNFGRIVLAAEALAFTKNQQFSWDSKSFSPLCESYQRKGERFGLFIPMKGEPSVRVVPEIQKTTTTTPKADNVIQVNFKKQGA